jgi:hypothetical protein
MGAEERTRHHTAKGQKAVEDLLKKNENANADGYIVTVTESWWIPEIGAYSMTSYDAFGSKVGLSGTKADSIGWSAGCCTRGWFSS